MRKLARLVRWLGVACSLVALPCEAAPEVRIEATPTLGAGSPTGDGWTSVAVRLENPNPVAVAGTVELFVTPGFSSDEGNYVTRAPYSLPPRARVTLELPAHGFAGRPPDLRVRVLDSEDQKLTEVSLGEAKQSDPLIFDLNTPSRVATTVRGIAMALLRRTGSGYRVPVVAVSSPLVDIASGEPLLPRWSAAYSNATLVLCSGRRFSTLPEGALVALTDWVLAGGALALTIDRPEDLRFPRLEAMLGGSPRATPPPAGMLSTSTFLIPFDNSGDGSAPSFPPRTQIRREELAPPSRLVDGLRGYSGGNLRPTPWGAAASYGLGEVHLLAFPTDESSVSDAWVKLKLVDLTRHAWERETTVALPLGSGALDDHRTSLVRKVLDPNESMRVPIILSALVLLVYAGLAGPLNFYLAARRGRPLRAVLWLPVWAGLTMLTVVLIGAFAKGIEGRARRLTLVEVGAGVSRGSAARFRGLYTPSARELVVRPTLASNLLDVATEGTLAERVLVVDREGTRIDRLRAKPWQTMVIREDGTFELAGGVSIVKAPNGEVSIKNRTAHDLVGAVLKTAEDTFSVFPRIADGASVSASGGETISVGTLSGTPHVHLLGVDSFKAKVDAAADGLGKAWEALSGYSGGEVDWWPEGVPVLIAQLDGGEGQKTDTGLRVDTDHVLVRVVGFGGVP